MVTSEQLLNYQFSKAGMNGYKALEVDELITAVAETVSFYEKKVRDMQRIIDDLKKEETVIQATLVKAQKLADQVTEEAKTKADDVIAQAQAQADALRAENEAKIAESTAKAEKAVSEMIENAKTQSANLLGKAKRTTEEMTRATSESQAQQELLLASMKNEVAAFRAKLIEQYKEHIRLIEQLPNETVVMPQKAAVPEPEEPQGTGSNLVKILGEMKANESAAADAVDEVAELTTAESHADSPVQPVPAETEPEVRPAAPRAGGFRVIIDDEEE